MKRYLPLAGLCLAVFLAMTGMGMAGMALPEKYLHSSGTMRSAGWLASVFALSYMACQYPAGRLADRHGYRGVLACGFLLMAASALLYDMAQTTWAIYAGRLLQGAGEAPVWASAPALLGRLYPDIRGRAIGLYNAAFHLGLVAGPVAGAWQAGASSGSPFAVFAWLCAGAMLLVMLTTGGTQGHGKPRAAVPGPSAMLRRIWPAACGLPLFGAAYGLLTSSFPVHLGLRPGYSPRDLGMFFLCVYSGIAVAQCVAGRLSDRHGRMPFMAGGLLGISAGLWGFLSAPEPLFPAFVLVLGLGLGTFAVASMALIGESSPQASQGTYSGLYYLAWGSGYFAGPLMVNAMGLNAGVTVLMSCTLAVSGFICLHARDQAQLQRTR